MYNFSVTTSCAISKYYVTSVRVCDSSQPAKATSLNLKFFPIIDLFFHPGFRGSTELMWDRVRESNWGHVPV